MTRYERLRYEMFPRVRDFGTAQRELFPESSAGGRAFAMVAQAAAEIQDQMVTKRVAAGAGAARFAARAATVKAMRIIARTAKGVARTMGPMSRLRIPKRTSDYALLMSAHVFLHAGEAHKVLLEEFALPATCLDELCQAADALEDALGARRRGRSCVAVARAGIDAAFARGFDAVRALDIIVANVLEDDAPRFAAWQRSRKLVAWRPVRVPAVVLAFGKSGDQREAA